jgi:hypothetical protein
MVMMWWVVGEDSASSVVSWDSGRTRADSPVGVWPVRSRIPVEKIGRES